jgi:hypothetical protein
MRTQRHGYLAELPRTDGCELSPLIAFNRPMTSEIHIPLKEPYISIDWDEPQLWLPVNFDLPEEHVVRAHPKAGLVVQRAVHHHGLKRFTVAGNPDNFVLATFVMTIAAEPCVGEIWQIAHGCK